MPDAFATTLDPAEVEKFSALAVEWWNPEGPFGALHRLNPLRLGYIRDVAQATFPHRPAPLRRPLDGLAALDLGCGGGLVSVPLARMGVKVTAIDASAEAIGAARAYSAQAGLNIDFRCTTAEALLQTGASFDLVAALEVIEHVADVPAFLRVASALVRPGGLLALSTINRTARARAFAIFGAERILKWAPEGAHDFDKLVTPDEIRSGAPEIVWDEPVGLAYQPLGRGWTLSRDVSINYLMAGHRR